MNNSIKICLYGPYPPHYGGLATQTLSLYQHLVKEGIVIYKINYIHRLYEIPKYIYYCFKYCIKCDVVHIICSSYKSFYRASLLIVIGKIIGRKIVLMSEGETENFIKNRYLFVYPMLRMVDDIIVYSGYLEKVFNKFGFDVKIIPGFISDIFTYSCRSNVKPIILMAKNIRPEYNYLCAIKAFQIIKNKFPKAKLIIAGKGEGDYYISLQKYIQQNKITGITFLGTVLYENMPELYNKADIFLNTTNIDNFPRCILESFAAGTITVSTKVGGIPYMIKDNYNGFLVKPKCYRDIADTIINIIANPDLAARISHQTRVVFENNYTWEKVKNKYISLYK